jgi:hypothetical protein
MRSIRQRASDGREPIMLRGLLAVALVSLALVGCAHIHPADPRTSETDLERMNSDLAGRMVLLRLSDGSELVAQDVRVAADSVHLRRRTVPLVSSPGWTRAVAALPIADVRAIEVTRRGRGALEGGLMGLGVGVLLGVPIGGSWYREGVPPSLGESMVVGSVIFGVLGGASGVALGVGIGSTDVYDLSSGPPPN